MKQHLTFENVSEDIPTERFRPTRFMESLGFDMQQRSRARSFLKESDAAMDLTGWGRPYILDEEEKDEEGEKKKNKKRRRDTSSSDSDSTQTSPSKPPPSKRAAATPQKTTTKRSSNAPVGHLQRQSSTTTRSGPVRKSRRARKPKNHTIDLFSSMHVWGDDHGE